jgi:hypothetical protein
MRHLPIAKCLLAGIPAANTGSRDRDSGSDQCRVEDSESSASEMRKCL